MVRLPVPLRGWFEDAMRSVKSADTNEQLLVRLGTGNLVSAMCQVVQTFASEEFALSLGFCHTRPAGGCKKDEDELVLRVLHQLITNFVGEMAPTALSYMYEPPFMLARLLSTDVEMVDTAC
eukprot:4205785-Amphidinium_carterae.1